jgi:hypothetical protein
MATSVGRVASVTEADTGNSGSPSDDVLDVGVGWGVSVSRQMRHTSLLLVGVVVTGGDDAGVNVRVEARGGSNAKSSASGGEAVADIHSRETGNSARFQCAHAFKGTGL